MPTITPLSEEEEMNLHREQMQEVSGIGIKQEHTINEDDLMALIYQTNNQTVKKKEDASAAGSKQTDTGADTCDEKQEVSVDDSYDYEMPPEEIEENIMEAPKYEVPLAEEMQEEIPSSEDISDTEKAISDVEPKVRADVPLPAEEDNQKVRKKLPVTPIMIYGFIAYNLIAWVSAFILYYFS